MLNNNNVLTPLTPDEIKGVRTIMELKYGKHWYLCAFDALIQRLYAVIFEVRYSNKAG